MKNFYFNNDDLIVCDESVANDDYMLEGACPESITYELVASNGYDSIKAEVTLDFGNGGFHHSIVLNNMLQDMKNIAQSLSSQYMPKPAVEEKTVVKNVNLGNASPKQRQILLRNGYSEAEVDAMTQKEASEAVKEIFESRN